VAQLILDISCYKNRLVMTAGEFVQKVYFGVAPIDPKTGVSYPYAYIESSVITAQQQVEDDLSLAINKTLVSEKRPFDRQYAENYFDTPVSFPIEIPLKLSGGLDNTNQLTFEANQLSGAENSRKSRGRSIRVTSGLANSVFFPFFNFSFIGGQGASQNPYATIPDFWRVWYTSGYDVAPADLIEYAEKLADWDLANKFGDFIGLGGGIASASISLDGLSQSVGTTNSATSAAFGARMVKLKEWFDRNISSLQARYNFSVL
jgi:hypothetical protein